MQIPYGTFNHLPLIHKGDTHYSKRNWLQGTSVLKRPGLPDTGKTVLVDFSLKFVLSHLILLAPCSLLSLLCSAIPLFMNIENNLTMTFFLFYKSMAWDQLFRHMIKWKQNSKRSWCLSQWCVYYSKWRCKYKHNIHRKHINLIYGAEYICIYKHIKIGTYEKTYYYNNFIYVYLKKIIES